jgi:5-methylcytosine-specific restriction enzyme subunit McrC
LDYSQGSLRKLYEEAIRNFYRVNLTGWRVGARSLSWPSDGPLDPRFPAMRTDITLDRPDRTRIIIDTKFTSALSAKAEYHEPRLHSGHLYQLYAYLHTQTGRGDPSANHADGLLLYPSTDQAPDIDVAATMHEHTLRIATLDLTTPPSAIRARLLNLVMARGAIEHGSFDAVPPPQPAARD